MSDWCDQPLINNWKTLIILVVEIDGAGTVAVATDTFVSAFPVVPDKSVKNGLCDLDTNALISRDPVELAI
jgi:hypothetical protein